MAGTKTFSDKMSLTLSRTQCIWQNFCNTMSVTQCLKHNNWATMSSTKCLRLDFLATISVTADWLEREELASINGSRNMVGEPGELCPDCTDSLSGDKPGGSAALISFLCPGLSSSLSPGSQREAIYSGEQQKWTCCSLIREVAGAWESLVKQWTNSKRPEPHPLTQS